MAVDIFRGAKNAKHLAQLNTESMLNITLSTVDGAQTSKTSSGVVILMEFLEHKLSH